MRSLAAGGSAHTHTGRATQRSAVDYDSQFIAVFTCTSVCYFYFTVFSLYLQLFTVIAHYFCIVKL